jgi:hypothetical protein
VIVYFTNPKKPPDIYDGQRRAAIGYWGTILLIWKLTGKGYFIGLFQL